MKLGFFIGGLSGGGAERVCCNLANFLTEQGHDVKIITMADDTPSYNLSAKVSRIILLQNTERKNFIFNSVLRYARLIKVVKKERFDCIIVMLPVTTILLLSIRSLFNSKVIAAERVDPSIYSSNKQSKLKKLAHRANAWVFQTKEQCQWYGESVGNAIIRIIPNAINQGFIKGKYTGERECVIANSGRLTKQKNQSLLIRAFARISEKFPQYKLKIYGDGPLLNELRVLSEQLGVAERVIFSGYVRNISDELEKACLYVLSSDFEGMPNALIEAMALGLPCISTDCDGGGAKFLIQNKVNGLLVPKGDEYEMAQAIESVLGDVELSTKISRNAEKIKEELSPNKIYGEWLTLIKQVVDNN